MEQDLNRLLVASIRVGRRQWASIGVSLCQIHAPANVGLAESFGDLDFPLTRRVSFTTQLQSGPRIQVPKVVRWEFKLEPNQTLKVGLRCLSTRHWTQYFYARMSKDGRIYVPELVLLFFKSKELPDLPHCILEVNLQPAQLPSP